MATLGAPARFDLVVDEHAKAWLDAHPKASRVYVAFQSARACCSGVRVCDVRIAVNVVPSTRGGGHVSWSSFGQIENRDVFIDSRLTERMPQHVALTARGVGPFRHLDLDLTGEQWADLLYPL